MPWLKQKSFEEICSPLLARAEHHDRFAELDGLRGIAAIWVMLFHFTKGLTLFWLSNNLTLANEITPLSINIRGTSAVELFFIISGYVIFMTLRRCRNLSDFFASRFARLFPAYWVAVAVSTIVGMLLPAANLPVNIMQAIGNLTMLQAYLGIPGVDPSYWSLAFELAFYVLMGVVFHFRLLGRIEQLGFA
jgi:peptidoglycan/LPS O-acetylase OafA/YrhL